MLQMIQQGPAQTMNYMIAGFVVIFGVMAIYLASLVIRRRSLKQDLETLEDFSDHQEA
jgi:hypothetical protein